MWDAAIGDTLLTITRPGIANYPRPGIVAFADQDPGYLAATNAFGCVGENCSSSGWMRHWDAGGTEVFSLAMGRTIMTFAQHGGFLVTARHLSPNSGNNVFVHSFPDGELLASWALTIVRAATFTHDGSQLILLDNDNTLTVRDVPSWEVLHTLSIPNGAPARVRLSEDGSRLLVGARRDPANFTPYFTVVDTGSWEILYEFPLQSVDGITVTGAAGAFTENGDYVVTRTIGTAGVQIAHLLEAYRVADGERIGSILLGTHGWNDHTSADIRRLPGTSRYAYLVQDSLRVIELDDPRFTVPAEPPPRQAGLEVNLFPNPASHAAHLTLSGTADDVLVELFDLLGRCVRHLSQETALSGRIDVPLDLRGLSAGLYVVRVVADGEAHARRLTVLR